MSAENSPGRADRGQMLLIALVALALIASLIMLFTDSAGALKLALLAALWAAIIGFFLVTQYRRRAERSQEELAHREELHRIEMDRMEAVRRHQEASKQIELRDDQLARDTEVLEDIKRELAALRTQLEELNGREFGYEPAALRAEARRIQELEARTSAARSSASRSSTTGSSFSDLGGLEDMGELADLDDDAGASTSGPRAGAGTGTGTDAPRRHVPGAPSPDAVIGRLGQYEPTRPQVNPLAHLISESYHDDRQEETPGRDRVRDPRSIFDTGAFQNVPWNQGGAEDARPQATTPEKEAEPEQEQEPAEETRTGSAGTSEGTGGTGDTGNTAAPESAEDTSAGDGKQPEQSDKADQAEKDDKPEKDEKPGKPGKKSKSRSDQKADKADKSGRGAEELEKSGKDEDSAEKSEAPEPSETSGPAEAESAEETGEDEETTPASTPSVPAPAADDDASEPRRGRRRRDEHTDGISVAELLANLKKEQ